MIDSMLFAVDVPAGSYTAGQVLPMSCIRGPSVVRDGYGSAILKNVVTFSPNAAIGRGTYVDVKNANWNDSLKNTLIAVNATVGTALSKYSPCIQKGGNQELQPNSAMVVNLVIGDAVTTTIATTAFCLIDIDYPSVAAVQNPADESGTPVSIVRDDSIVAVDSGDSANMVWTTVNVDEFKAGYRYLLTQIGMLDGYSLVGFVAFSGAPSMNGLVRIIPVIPKYTYASRMELDYSTPLVKGPMNIEYAAMGTAGTFSAFLECDYIRR